MIWTIIAWIVMALLVAATFFNEIKPDLEFKIKFVICLITWPLICVIWVFIKVVRDNQV